MMLVHSKKLLTSSVLLVSILFVSPLFPAVSPVPSVPSLNVKSIIINDVSSRITGLPLHTQGCDLLTGVGWG